MRWLAIIALLTLTACATPEPVPVLHNVCLPMVEYSATEQAQAAKELSAMPPGAELPKMMTDYGKMRAANRACTDQ